MNIGRSLNPFSFKRCSGSTIAYRSANPENYMNVHRNKFIIICAMPHWHCPSATVRCTKAKCVNKDTQWVLVRGVFMALGRGVRVELGRVGLSEASQCDRRKYNCIEQYLRTEVQATVECRPIDTQLQILCVFVVCE